MLEMIIWYIAIDCLTMAKIYLETGSTIRHFFILVRNTISEKYRKNL